MSAAAGASAPSIPENTERFPDWVAKASKDRAYLRETRHKIADYGKMVTTKEGLYSTIMPIHACDVYEFWRKNYSNIFGSSRLPVGVKAHLIDATANIGGDAIHAAISFPNLRVDAIERDPTNASAARYNISSVKDLDSRVNLRVANTLEMLGLTESSGAASAAASAAAAAASGAAELPVYHVAYFDPPWGGPEVWKDGKDISLSLDGESGEKVLLETVVARVFANFVAPDRARGFAAREVVIKAPSNFGTDQFVRGVADALEAELKCSVRVGIHSEWRVSKIRKLRNGRLSRKFAYMMYRVTFGLTETMILNAGALKRSDREDYQRALVGFVEKNLTGAGKAEGARVIRNAFASAPGHLRDVDIVRRLREIKARPDSPAPPASPDTPDPPAPPVDVSAPQSAPQTARGWAAVAAGSAPQTAPRAAPQTARGWAAVAAGSAPQTAPQSAPQTARGWAAVAAGSAPRTVPRTAPQDVSRTYASGGGARANSRWDELSPLLKDLQIGDDSAGVSRYLDVGCAEGGLTRAIGEGLEGLTGREWEMHGVDVEIDERTEGPVKFTKASAVELPFEDAHFDVVSFVMALHHIAGNSDLGAALREAARVLKPGGLLIIREHNVESRAWFTQFLDCVHLFYAMVFNDEYEFDPDTAEESLTSDGREIILAEYKSAGEWHRKIVGGTAFARGGPEGPRRALVRDRFRSYWEVFARAD